MPADVSLVILTQRRLAALARAAASALAQQGVENYELVIVDNDAQPSARTLVEGLAAPGGVAVRYIYEPRAGVANARNAAIASASAPLIAFLDDDEEAPPGWLGAMLDAQRRFDADVVFGPVRGRAPADVPHRAYLEWFFSRLGPEAAGPIAEPYGCGCSLIRRGALPDAIRPFAERANETGGEDDILFGQMKAAGARFAWAPAAWVWEDPVPERLRLGYALKRAFVYGQGPPYHCFHRDRRDLAGVFGWMLIGAGQAIVYGLLAGSMWMLRVPNRAFMFDRAMRGLGKVLWFGPFKMRLYGQVAPRAASAGSMSRASGQSAA